VALTPAIIPAPSAISGPAYSPNVPWFALTGSAGSSEHSPETSSYATAGTFTYTVPSWKVSGDFFDIALVGGGAGSAWSGAGFGGGAGSWTAITLQYGVDIPTGTTAFTVTVGAGGTPGTVSVDNGTPGGSGSVAIKGYASTPLTAAGGAIGTGFTSQNGGSPGNQTLNGTTYYGGAVQTVANSAGHAPGGGASDDRAVGAPGQVWISSSERPP
jgi:hypothetical protein